MSQREERIQHLFGVSIEAQVAAADSLSPLIARASKKLVDCLLNDRKILLCGNGGSAANILHFSAVMMGHLEVERPSLPIIALSTDMASITAIANHTLYDQIFVRQIHALGIEGDILMVLTTSGNSNSILHAVSAAQDRGMDTIALTGRDGGILTNHLGPEDIEIRANAEHALQIREQHLFILHCFCDLIDQSLFGQLME